ncbi:methionine aminopeptidase 1D, mitochondrial-like [Pollicipes pollicipes]|uniref:methionine aminopeptidase 1D, mitochondrial-like n=1 Tax=Pollicipes pollicipes TaxID=41117 RepID=UPI001884E412|nr:methionine aminopeptidase 1D, mitochondrial-like [Pollicipes pollicipes]
MLFRSLPCCLISDASVLRNRRRCFSFWNLGTQANSSRFGRFEVVEPGKVLPAQLVPEHIKSPPWADSGAPPTPPNIAECKTEDSIQKMRRACRLASKILHSVKHLAKPGVTTEAIDQLAHQLTVAHGAYPSPLNYRGFPKSVCTSVNNVACHGIPDDRPLRSGDIVNIDVTVYLDGHNGDCSETYAVGEVDARGRRLLDVARRCLDDAVALCRPGMPFSDIGGRVETTAAYADHAVVPAFIGHGIGTYFHGPPDVYHCWNTYPGTMQPGMTFTIEPVVTQGGREVVLLEDGWTAVSADGSRSAQFEHTVLITEDGVEVLTGPPPLAED